MKYGAGSSWILSLSFDLSNSVFIAHRTGSLFRSTRTCSATTDFAPINVIRKMVAIVLTAFVLILVSSKPVFFRYLLSPTYKFYWHNVWICVTVSCGRWIYLLTCVGVYEFGLGLLPTYRPNFFQLAIALLLSPYFKRLSTCFLSEHQSSNWNGNQTLGCIVRGQIQDAGELERFSEAVDRQDCVRNDKQQSSNVGPKRPTLTIKAPPLPCQPDHYQDDYNIDKDRQF